MPGKPPAPTSSARVWQKPNLLNCGLAVAEAVPRPFTPVGFSFWVFPSTLRSLGFRPHSEHDLGYNLLPHRCIAEITKARKAQNQLLFHGTLLFVLLRATHCAGIRSMELARFRLALKGQMPRTCMGLALKIDFLLGEHRLVLVASFWSTVFMSLQLTLPRWRLLYRSKSV